jgi:hypothetical protein
MIGGGSQAPAHAFFGTNVSLRRCIICVVPNLTKSDRMKEKAMSKVRYVPTLLLAAAAFVAIGIVPAQAKRAQARRETKPGVTTAQKWEYCAITGVSAVTRGGKFLSVAELCYFRGASCQEGKIEGSDNNEALARAISALGEDGWEMVGENLFPPRGQDFKAMYFKRPKR